MQQKRLVDSWKRSLTKAFTWRVLATLMTLAIAYSFTQEVMTSIALAISVAVLNTTLYFIHERFWSQLGWGRVYAKAKRTR